VASIAIYLHIERRQSHHQKYGQGEEIIEDFMIYPDDEEFYFDPSSSKDNGSENGIQHNFTTRTPPARLLLSKPSVVRRGCSSASASSTSTQPLYPEDSTYTTGRPKGIPLMDFQSGQRRYTPFSRKGTTNLPLSAPPALGCYSQEEEDGIFADPLASRYGSNTTPRHNSNDLSRFSDACPVSPQFLFGAGYSHKDGIINSNNNSSHKRPSIFRQLQNNANILPTLSQDEQQQQHSSRLPPLTAASTLFQSTKIGEQLSNLWSNNFPRNAEKTKGYPSQDHPFVYRDFPRHDGTPCLMFKKNNLTTINGSNAGTTTIHRVTSSSSSVEDAERNRNLQTARLSIDQYEEEQRELQQQQHHNQEYSYNPDYLYNDDGVIDDDDDDYPMQTPGMSELGSVFRSPNYDNDEGSYNNNNEDDKSLSSTHSMEVFIDQLENLYQLKFRQYRHRCQMDYERELEKEKYELRQEQLRQGELMKQQQHREGESSDVWQREVQMRQNAENEIEIQLRQNAEKILLCRQKTTTTQNYSNNNNTPSSLGSSSSSLISTPSPASAFHRRATLPSSEGSSSLSSAGYNNNNATTTMPSYSPICTPNSRAAFARSIVDTSRLMKSTSSSDAHANKKRITVSDETIHRFLLSNDTTPSSAAAAPVPTTRSRAAVTSPPRPPSSRNRSSNSSKMKISDPWTNKTSSTNITAAATISRKGRPPPFSPTMSLTSPVPHSPMISAKATAAAEVNNPHALKSESPQSCPDDERAAKNASKITAQTTTTATEINAETTATNKGLEKESNDNDNVVVVDDNNDNRKGGIGISNITVNTSNLSPFSCVSSSTPTPRTSGELPPLRRSASLSCDEPSERDKNDSPKSASKSRTHRRSNTFNDLYELKSTESPSSSSSSSSLTEIPRKRGEEPLSSSTSSPCSLGEAASVDDLIDRESIVSRRTQQLINASRKSSSFRHRRRSTFHDLQDIKKKKTIAKSSTTKSKYNQHRRNNSDFTISTRSTISSSTTATATTSSISTSSSLSQALPPLRKVSSFGNLGDGSKKTHRRSNTLEGKSSSSSRKLGTPRFARRRFRSFDYEDSSTIRYNKRCDDDSVEDDENDLFEPVIRC